MLKFNDLNEVQQRRLLKAVSRALSEMINFSTIEYYIISPENYTDFVFNTDDTDYNKVVELLLSLEKRLK